MFNTQVYTFYVQLKNITKWNLDSANKMFKLAQNSCPSPKGKQTQSMLIFTFTSFSEEKNDG